MLKTNWSHVVAQKPPPTWPVIPRDFTIPSAVENSTKQTPWSEKAFAVNLTFRGGKVTWKSIKLEWMAMNGWQLFIRDDLFHPNWLNDGKFLNLCEGSKVYWRTSFEILVSWNHLAVPWGTHPTALPSIRECPIFLPKLFGKILEIQTSISVGYGLWQLKHCLEILPRDPGMVP